MILFITSLGRLTSAWPMMRSAQVFHCGHLSRSSNVAKFESQQHCSWLNQNLFMQIPSFKSAIQSAAMSIRPARAPVDTHFPSI